MTSTLINLGKALEERTGWGKRRRARVSTAQTTNEALDNEVLSEVFSKFGIETKIDKIEAEFNAEAKAARAATRSKSSSTTKDTSPGKSPHSHFDAYGNPASHAHHHRFWTIIVYMLGVTLAIQSVFLFRNPIARSFPGMRPALVSVCNIFGCAMPLPREASQVEIEYYSVTLVQQSERVGRYAFYVKLKNNANFTQDWPSLELTLRNFIEQPLSRRIFTPAEWVPSEMFAQNAGMAPGKVVDVNLDLDVTEIVPSNFVVDHFYP